MSTEVPSQQNYLRIATGVLLLASVAVHVLAPILVWTWSQVPFVGAMLEKGLTVGMVMASWNGTKAGLAPSDRIVAINGQAVHNGRELQSAIRSFAPGEAIVATVENHGGLGEQTRELAITLQVFPFGDLLIDFILPYLVGLWYLSVGMWAFWHQRSDARVLWFVAYCAGFSILVSTTFDKLSTHSLIFIHAASYPLTGIALLYLALSYFREGGLLRSLRWHWRLTVVAIACTALTWISLAFADPQAFRLALAIAQGFWAASILAALALLAAFRLRPSYLRTRLQAQAVLMGMLVSLMPLAPWAIGSMLHQAFPLVQIADRMIPPIVLPWMIVFPLLAVFAFQRYRQLEHDSLLNPLYDSLPNYREALRNFRQELAGSLDLDYILNVLSSYISKTLRPSHVLALMISPQSGRYEVHSSWGSAGNHHTELAFLTPQDKVISRLQRSAQSILLTKPTLDELRLDAQEQRRVEHLAAILLVPIHSKERLLGVLALGTPESQDVYAEDEIALVSAMTSQAAIAADNALLYARQVEQERRLLQQTRQLTDILALGNQLKSLDRDTVVQKTVEAIYASLGYRLVTLSLVEENDPARVRVVAWAGIESTTWERLTSRSFPLIDPEVISGVRKLGDCYFIHAAETTPEISTTQKDVPWCEGDQLFVPLTSNEGLLGYLTIDRPHDGLRPNEEKIEVLEIFANQAAIAIQNANLYANIDRALDERVAELATLQEIDRQINTQLDFEHVMDMTLDWAIRITSAIAGTLALVSEDQQALRIVAHRGYSPEITKLWDVSWPVEEGIIGRVIQTAQPVMDDNVAQSVDYGHGAAQTQSHLAAPILHEDRVIGVISLESNDPAGFTADHLAFLMRLADHAAIAIENVVLYEQTHRRVAELSALQQISLDLTSQLNLSAVLDSIAANTLELAQADQINIYLYDEHEDALLFGTGLAQRGKLDRPPIPIPQNRITASVARQGEAIVIQDAQTHPLLLETEWDVGAIASMPLRKAEHVLGVFDISYKTAHPFTSDELRALGLLADQAAVAIENAQFYAEARRATEEKDEFVNTVSHALKAPMTSIQGYARLLTVGAGGPLSQQQQEFADVISRNVERMNRLVNDLLDLSRLKSGHIKLSCSHVDLARLVRDAIRSIDVDRREAELPVSTDIPPDLDHVYVDPSRMTQVWAYLIQRAAQQVPEDGAVRVWAKRHVNREESLASKSWILCAVQDSGRALAPEEQSGLFEALYNVQNRPAADESTGLELAIVRAIVELHGGRIWVESKPGEGNCFCFTLPGADAPNQ